MVLVVVKLILPPDILTNEVLFCIFHYTVSGIQYVIGFCRTVCIRLCI